MTGLVIQARMRDKFDRQKGTREMTVVQGALNGSTDPVAGVDQ